MKKRLITAGVICTLIASMSLSSCIGSFALTHKLLGWNNNINNKFVNELVFAVFWIIPVYEVSALADILVLNSIEFWSGSSPVASKKSVIDGTDGKYLVERDSKGYTITAMNDNSKVRLDFDAPSQTWSVAGEAGKSYPLMTMIDANHVKINVGGNMMLVEKSQEGLYALQQAVLKNTGDLAMK